MLLHHDTLNKNIFMLLQNTNLSHDTNKQQYNIYFFDDL